MSSVYLNIFYIFIVLAVVLLALSIVLFLRFNIPKVVGDITGSNYKKSIKKTREINEKSGKKAYKPSKVNQERGMITDDINSQKKKSNIAYGNMSTEDLDIPQQINNGSENTTVLGSDATSVSNDNTTTVLGDNGTSVLSNNTSEQTTVLGAQENQPNNAVVDDELPDVEVSDFTVEEDISFSESGEVIV